jgi:osmoprotectant transport system ATP-binding protein
MGDVVCKLVAVHTRLAGKQVLDGLSLEVKNGETLVIVGQTGCGKSTILRLLVGLLAPDSGEVYFRDHLLATANLNDRRRHIGYVIQEGGLFPHLSAFDNIVLMARHIGWPGKVVAERVAELVAMTRFPEDALQRFPSQLSGGQRQRVALMRALMLDPDLLLLDEPLGALDPMVRFDLQNELKVMFQSLGKAAVVVTHDLHEADFLADRIMLLQNGKIAQAGCLQDFIDRPASEFVARFVGAQRGMGR